MMHVPPHNLEAEGSLLSCCLADKGAMIAAAAVLIAEDFYGTAHGIVWNAMKRILARRQGVDVITVTNELRHTGNLEDIGDVAGLMDIAGKHGLAPNVDHYAEIIRKKATLRRCIYEAQKLALAAYDENEEELAAAKTRLINVTMGRTDNDLRHISEGVREFFDQVTECNGEGIGVRGFVKTGFRSIDDMTGGLPRGGLTVVAARPSMGKTTLTNQISVNIAKEMPVGLFSLEDPGLYFVTKCVGVQGMVSSAGILRGPITEEMYKRIHRSVNDMNSRKLWYTDRRCKMAEIHEQSRRLMAREGELGAVVIDRIELTDDEQGKAQRVHFIGELSKQASRLAKDLYVPVVLIVQLSRECDKRSDKRPVLSDLRDSGAIEQDATQVLFIYRDEYYNEGSEDKGVAEILIPKTKMGPTGFVRLAWIPDIPMFGELSEEDGGKRDRTKKRVGCEGRKHDAKAAAAGERDDDQPLI